MARDGVTAVSYATLATVQLAKSVHTSHQHHGEQLLEKCPIHGLAGNP